MILKKINSIFRFLKNIFTKDQLIFGFVMGLIAPIGGFIIFKNYKLAENNWRDVLEFLLFEDYGHKMLTVGISLSLLANAVLFTIYINSNIDKTAKGIFAATIIYALTALSLKTFW